MYPTVALMTFVAIGCLMAEMPFVALIIATLVVLLMRGG